MSSALSLVLNMPCSLGASVRVPVRLSMWWWKSATVFPLLTKSLGLSLPFTFPSRQTPIAWLHRSMCHAILVRRFFSGEVVMLLFCT